ncbi:hypothetical protein Lal_00009938 [Lupinus albus]|nr:hypothetical protein Lal_00009938 [Lupinus albus]
MTHQTIKSTLKLFELSSCLKINFSKCSLFGLNVEDSLIRRLTDFLHCRLSPKSFSYLGILVGVNHNRKWPLVFLLQRTFRISSPSILHLQPYLPGLAIAL